MKKCLLCSSILQICIGIYTIIAGIFVYVELCDFMWCLFGALLCCMLSGISSYLILKESKNNK